MRLEFQDFQMVMIRDVEEDVRRIRSIDVRFYVVKDSTSLDLLRLIRKISY